ncbi:carbohydrate esterase family 3 protein [Durotheca rogersii]|uniref:carbohydrate esterase family 3 protein n=1 Tax=Durotheca rogersii TaxID=419775 RepID=UPI00221F0894|nr:carbohydrate esterase family 3 protein [Durotheca rogersii]KAI5860788.1 carbohydrate esterase family 3 protein [Durotheca rogersii]
MPNLKRLYLCVLACTSSLVCGLALPSAAGANREPALPRAEVVARNFADGAALRIMPLGASITYGYGSSDGNGYREALRDRVAARGNAVNMVGTNHAGNMPDNDNEGWKSYTVAMVHGKADASVPGIRPNLVLVNVGTNDCLHGEDLLRAGDRVASLLSDIFTQSPRATVILSTLVANRDPQVAERVTDFNAQLRTVSDTLRSAGQRLVLVDMQGPAGPTLDDLSSDGTHPNDVGYLKMADVWFGGIEEADRQHYLLTPEPV